MEPICIFCKQFVPGGAPPEHIIPESLGCPGEFVFKNGQVCYKCNTNLSRLDAELNDSFGMFKVHSVGKNKKGNPSSTHNNNFFAKNSEGHIEIYINAGTHSQILPNGKVLSPANSQSYIRDINLERNGSVTKINCRIPFIRSKKTIRGLYKIAFGALCFFKGREYVLDKKFDEVRHYILSGIGEKGLLLGGGCKPSLGQGHKFNSVMLGLKGEHVIPFEFFGIQMAVQLSPGTEALKAVAQKSGGEVSFINESGIAII